MTISPPIADAINEIVQKELDVTLEFEVSNYGDSHYLTTFISTDERPDLFYSSETEFLAANNFVLPLDDLLNEYGEDILNLYDDYILDACRYHGSLYGIVSNKDFAASECICVRKDLLDKYSIPYEWMSDWDTMVKAFDVIKENEPDMYCVNTYLFSPIRSAWRLSWRYTIYRQYHRYKLFRNRLFQKSNCAPARMVSKGIYNTWMD